jgi:hypothetical protein
MEQLAELATSCTVWVGFCEVTRQSATGRTVVVREKNSGNLGETLTADCLDHVRPIPGDCLLLVHPETSRRPLVLGTIGSARRTALALSSGYTAEAETFGLRLRGPDGRAVLEIDTSGPAPRLRPIPGDVELDLTGRLKIAARAIDLQSKLGDMTLRANDDVIVTGERIRLN